MSLTNITSGSNALSSLESGFVPPSNSIAGKGGETITVTMRGQTAAAHADAILEHYNFTKADEAKFKELYGVDLRQDLTDAYTRKDNRSAHTPLGKGLYRVEIPITKELLAQIRTVKAANQQPATRETPNPLSAAVEKMLFDPTAGLRAQIESKLPATQNTAPSGIPVPAPAPVPLPDKSEYTNVDKVELLTTPDNANKLTVTIQTFIPFESVDGPNNPYETPLAPVLGNFEGDGRNVDQRIVIRNGKQTEATYRTKQVLDVDFNMPEGIDVGCQSFGQAGVSRDLNRWDNKTPLREDQAKGKTLQATARREGDTIMIEAVGDEGNPLIKGAPGITYNLKIRIEKQSNGVMTMTTNGLHDGFPGYEMFVSRPGASDADRRLTYGFDPRTIGNTPLALMGGLFGQRVLTSQTVIAPTPAITNQPVEGKQ